MSQPPNPPCGKNQPTLPFPFLTRIFYPSSHKNQIRSHSNATMVGVDTSENHVFLIWGGQGWVAGQVQALLQSQGRTVHITTVRMQDRSGVERELERVRPTHVLNCAGCTGRPNVDWCEDNKEETIRSNVIGTLNLTDCCFMKGIHLTVFATGCEFCPFFWGSEGARGSLR